MKRLFEGIRGQIILGILVALIFNIFFQPVVDVARNFSGNIFTFFVDLFFRFAAINSGNRFINFIALGLMTGYIFYIISNIKFRIKDLDENNNKIKNFIDNKDKDNESEELTSEEVNHIQVELKKIKKLSNIFVILSLVLFLFTVAYMYFPILFKEDFDMSILKITPYTDAQTVNMLKSDWVRMKSKKDFDGIKTRIDTIIQDHKLD